MIAYLDSSALVKLVATEPESAALAAALESWSERASSALARVEVRRAASRLGDDGLRRAEQVLTGVALLAVDDAVLETATRVAPLELRSPDAIHIASALSLGTRLDVLITYDRRMLGAAEASGLRAHAPR